MLLIGYGNPGRGDDGLGPAFSERFAARGFTGLDVDTDYQLVAEHALAVSGQDVVIFADAMIGGEGAFSFTEIGPDPSGALGSHSLQPQTVLALGRTLFGDAPKAFLMAISGYDYGDVKEGLSARALANLEEAECFFAQWLKTHSERDTAEAGA